MKLFLRSHLMLIGFLLAQLTVVLMVFWFDGYDHPRIALYAAFLGILIMSVYLTIQYFTLREFYRRLSEPNADIFQTPGQDGSAALARALDELLDHHYRKSRLQLRNWEREQAERLEFMNQWVHQMKTPLSVIELLTQESDNEEIDSISEEAERLRKGLEMVLYMSRLETFEQDFYVEQVELYKTVDEVVTDYKRLFIRSQVYPENLVDAGLTVETDAKWLRFILQQLLSNAIKFSAGSHQTVRISAFKSDQSIVLEVKDSGIGIPKQDVGRVFRPFFTGENGRSFKESTGMGLYLVQKVVQKLNHQIHMESEVGKGTTVYLTFPYASI
jgi:two-component system, OmpR family, sensor histidine kinase YxdK